MRFKTTFDKDKLLFLDLISCSVGDSDEVSASVRLTIFVRIQVLKERVQRTLILRGALDGHG